MSENPGEGYLGPADSVMAGLAGMLTCLHEALPDICSYGITIGSNYVPFDADPEEGCEDDEDDPTCSQLWIRPMNADVQTINPGWAGGACSADLTISIEVGVLRCFVIPEGGEAPTSMETTVAAFQSVQDMYALLNAAMRCDVWESIVAGQWMPEGPMGGQYGGRWTFTVTPK